MLVVSRTYDYCTVWQLEHFQGTEHYHHFSSIFQDLLRFWSTFHTFHTVHVDFAHKKTQQFSQFLLGSPRSPDITSSSAVAVLGCSTRWGSPYYGYDMAKLCIIGKYVTKYISVCMYACNAMLCYVMLCYVLLCM